MCSPDIISHVVAHLGPAERATGATRASDLRRMENGDIPRSFRRVLDLSHPLPETFPSANGQQWLRLEDFMTFDETGVNFRIWHIHEHIGTHIDAPIHFSADGESAEQVAIDRLVVPLAVIDIRARAAETPDTEVTPQDIRAWEAAHGRLPEGCCVAMNSGWDRTATGPGYRNADADGKMHFPGFHVEAAQMLLEERAVRGLAVDTLSFDHGSSDTFPTHRAWLSAGRWAAEGVANLGDVPARGATIVVGAPTVVGASGGPSRIIALV